MVEGATEVPDLVIAMAEAYVTSRSPSPTRTILSRRSAHNKAQIVLTFGSAKSLVSVFLQQDQWGQYIHRTSALTVDSDHVYNRRAKGVCPKLLTKDTEL
jgi:hypothetical protein